MAVAAARKESIVATVAALEKMTVTELKATWREELGEEPRSGNRQWLWKRLAWHIQAKAFGGLTERAKQRTRKLADETCLRVRPQKKVAAKAEPRLPTTVVRDSRLPAQGTVLWRDYRGQRLEVTVLDRGFEYDGVLYRSLSAVARAVTGTHWNGWAFFGLGSGNGKRLKRRGRPR